MRAIVRPWSVLESPSFIEGLLSGDVEFTPDATCIDHFLDIGFIENTQPIPDGYIVVVDDIASPTGYEMSLAYIEHVSICVAASERALDAVYLNRAAWYKGAGYYTSFWDFRNSEESHD